MQLTSLATRNVTRNKLRATLTVLGIAVAIVAFVLIRTAIYSWTISIDYAAKDRIASRHKVSFIMTLPLKYVQEIRDMPGVKNAALASWFGAKHPTREQDFFATIAVDPRTFLDVYDEVKVPDAQRDAWFANRRGALVGDQLAKRFGWKVGDKITLSGTIYPGNWEFDIAGIYTATRPSIDRASL